jgi:hypothetical protein
MYTSVHRFTCTALIFLSDSNKKLEFVRQIFGKYSNITFYNIHPLGAALLHVDGQRDRRTDMTKLLVALCNFANAPTKV